MAKRNLKMGKFSEFSSFEEIYHESVDVWSISIHQKLGFGPVSTIRLDTDSDSANLDMKDCF